MTDVKQLQEYARTHRPLRKAILLDSLSSGQPMVKRAMAAGVGLADDNKEWVVRLFSRFPHLAESFRSGDPRISDLVVIMVDLSPFAKHTASLTPDEIRTILDNYYSLVVPMLEKEGGVVEKFIGDAIVAVFGHPFRPNQEGERERATGGNDVAKAYSLAQDIINAVIKEFPAALRAKVSLVRGKLFLGWVGPDSYRELTVIGEPLTRLFRLEDALEANQILVERSLFDAHLRAHSVAKPGGEGIAGWLLDDAGYVDMKGIGRVPVARVTKRP